MAVQDPQPISSDVLAMQANPAYRAQGTPLPALVLQKIQAGQARQPRYMTITCPTGTVYMKPPAIVTEGPDTKSEVYRTLLRTNPGRQAPIDRVGMVPLPSRNAVARVPFGIAGLSEAEALPGAESVRLGAAITRQVTAMLNVQQGLYQALAALEPGTIRKLFGADSVPQYLRDQVDAWNSQVNKWWDPDFTGRAAATVPALQEWTALGKELIADAATVAGTLQAQTLFAQVKAFQAAFAKEMEANIQHAIQFVGSTASTVVDQTGKVLNTGAKAVSDVFGTISWGVIIPVVGAFGALALGFYMLKSAGVKADVGVGPAKVGLASLHAPRRRRRRSHRS